MKVETKRILLAVLVITLVLISGFSVMAGNASAQAFTPSHEMKLITQPGNNVTFPLGSVGVSLPNAINPDYTESQAPTGYISFISYTPSDNLPFTFGLHAVFDNGLPPYTYTWYLDGQEVGTGEYLIYTAHEAGAYHFTVKVVDQAFKVGTATRTVYVYAPLEVDSITLTNGTTTVGPIPENELNESVQVTTYLNTPVSIDVSGIHGGYPYWYYDSQHHRWYYYKVRVNWGDGNVGTYYWNVSSGNWNGAVPSHVYNSMGRYTITASVTGYYGSTYLYYFRVGVTSGPLSTNLYILNTPYSYQNGLPVYLLGDDIMFYGQLSGGLVPYNVTWNFGDGVRDIQYPVYGSHVIENHIYDHQGLYRVWMNTTDCLGNRVDRSIQFYILYKQPDNAQLSINATSMNYTQARNATFGTNVDVVLENGVVDYTLNLTWVYGKAPYTVSIQMVNETTGDVFWYNFTYNEPWTNLPFWDNTTNFTNPSHTPHFPVIDTPGDYRFNFTVRDSEGHATFSNIVYLHVHAPTFSADIGAAESNVCIPGNATIYVMAHNIKGIANTSGPGFNATMNVTLYMDGQAVAYWQGNVSGSTLFFDHIFEFTVALPGPGTYAFNATVKELSPEAQSVDTSTINVGAYSEHGLQVESFGASPQVLVGTAPFTVTFYINLTGGNGTLLMQFLSNHPNPEFYYAHTYVKNGGPPCNPYYNITYTYTFTNGQVYNTQFTFYSNNTAYTGPVYVNYTVTVWPPPPMHASLSISPTVIYLEPGPNETIYNDYGPYNYTTVTISVSGGMTPYYIHFYTSYTYIYNETLIDLSGANAVIISHSSHALNIKLLEEGTITLNLYYNWNSIYNHYGAYTTMISTGIGDSSGSTGCVFSVQNDITIVSPPALSIDEDYGSNAPTNLVAYGEVYSGAFPYSSIVMNILYSANGYYWSNIATFYGENGASYHFGSVMGSVDSPEGGYYNITLTVTDMNGYTWSIYTGVFEIGPPTEMYPVIVSARMQVYFDNTLVYAGPAVWDEYGTLNASFLMPNQAIADNNRIFDVNVQYSYTLYVPDTGSYYNVYSNYPYNSEPGKLMVINNGMLSGVNVSADMATIKALIQGTWHSVNVSYDYLQNEINSNLITVKDGVAQLQVQGATIEAKLNDLNANITSIQGDVATIQTDIGNIQTSLSNLDAKITDIQNGIATIQTDIGNIQTSLSNLDAKITDIQNGIATIQTDIGNIQTSLSNLDAKITKLQGDIATIQTDIGTVNVKLDAINATVVSNANGISDLKGSVVEIQTTLGDIKGTVTDVKDGVATIQTDLGTVKTDVSDIKTSTSDTASGINTAIYWNIGVLILVIITLILVAYVLAKVNKISQGPKEETVEEETEETKEE